MSSIESIATAEPEVNGTQTASAGEVSTEAPNRSKQSGSPDPSEFNSLTSARDMKNYVMAVFELRRSAEGAPYAVHRQTGERRALQGDRRSRGTEGTLREWLIAEVVERSKNGRPPSAGDLSGVMATLTRETANAAQDEPTPVHGESKLDVQASPQEELTRGEPAFRPEVPAICVNTLPVAVRALLQALGARRVPDLYTKGGAVVWVSERDGEMTTSPLAAAELVTHLEQHLDFWQENRFGEVDAVLCPSEVAARIVSRREHRLPVLERVVTTPVLLPDGRLLQEPGYDVTTGIYYHPRHKKLPPIPTRPDADEVRKARRFLLDIILGDFPWVSGEDGFDRANYVAGLVTPLFMSTLNANTPLFLVTAPERASGKTLLTDVLASVYGASDMPYVEDTQELRKQITAKLLESSAPVVVVDNVPNGGRVGNHVWATLLTKRFWEDRILGSTKQVRLIQDRAWWASGNNIGVRDDMRTRHYPVRIDPQQPNPEKRTGWRSEEVTGPGIYLGDWLTGEGGQEPNGWRVLYALLVLVMDWVAAGMPEAEITNRSFTAWARKVCGFMAHHNIGQVDQPDEEESEDENSDRWRAFFAQWWEKFGGRPVTARELHVSLGDHEAWPTTDGRDFPMTSQELGTALRAVKGQFYGDLAAYKAPSGGHNSVSRWLLRQAG